MQLFRQKITANFARAGRFYRSVPKQTVFPCPVVDDPQRAQWTKPKNTRGDGRWLVDVCLSKKLGYNTKTIEFTQKFMDPQQKVAPTNLSLGTRKTPVIF
jgi:hypothetical protein